MIPRVASLGAPPAPLRRVFSIMTVALLVAGHAAPALAYLKLGIQVNGRSVSLTWPRAPVRWYVSDRTSAFVTASELQAAAGRAFTTWEAVSTTSISYQFAGFTGALANQDDGLSTIGFLAAPELDRVLASTSFLIDVVTGEVLESDIFFNTAFAWSVSPAGTAGRYDVETIALHEFGHFSGLGHSALGETQTSGTGRSVLATEAVMFPIAFGPGTVANRTLRADDIAGLSDLYPAGDFRSRTGSVSGRVTKSGSGVLGAHIVAFHLETGALVGNFSLNRQGQFSIAGLAPGPYVIRVEPLDDASPESFFSSGADLDLDFAPLFVGRLVVVPRGGDSGTVDVAVRPK
jgi:hypothetical protein